MGLRLCPGPDHLILSLGWIIVIKAWQLSLAKVVKTKRNKKKRKKEITWIHCQRSWQLHLARIEGQRASLDRHDKLPIFISHISTTNSTTNPEAENFENPVFLIKSKLHIPHRDWSCLGWDRPRRRRWCRKWSRQERDPPSPTTHSRSINFFWSNNICASFYFTLLYSLLFSSPPLLLQRSKFQPLLCLQKSNGYSLRAPEIFWI